MMDFQKTNPDNHRCDQAAAAKVFLDHQDFIRKVITFHTQDKDQADDLFQDFFLSFVCRPLPRSIRNIESYLYRAITHDVMDIIRREAKYRECLKKYAEHSDYFGVCGTPLESFLEIEQASKTFGFIEHRLPGTEAQAIRLKYQDGLNAKETARRMRVDVSTVRGYLAKGLSRIRRLAKLVGAEATEENQRCPPCPIGGSFSDEVFFSSS